MQTEKIFIRRILNKGGIFTKRIDALPKDINKSVVLEYLSNPSIEEFSCNPSVIYLEEGDEIITQPGKR